jgi:hypothetical protein
MRTENQLWQVRDALHQRVYNNKRERRRSKQDAAGKGSAYGMV